MSDLIVWTTSVPTEPFSASRQSAGVIEGEMSFQRRPGMPTRTTGWGGELARTVLASAVLASDGAGQRGRTGRAGRTQGRTEQQHSGQRLLHPVNRIRAALAANPLSGVGPGRELG